MEQSDLQSEMAKIRVTYSTIQGFPFFFNTTNHFEQYEDWLNSYTPAAIFSLMTWITLSFNPGGIGIIHSSHGLWSTVGMMYSEKYDSHRVPHSTSSNAIPASLRTITCLNNFFSSGVKNVFLSIPSSSICEIEIFLVAINCGGCFVNFGKVNNGSSGICLWTQRCSEKGTDLGWIFWWTHL